MKKTGFVLLAMALVPCLFAVDGVVLINQSTVLAAGGFPYTISKPGSYKLSGDLDVGSALTIAIRITASNVTLDLNGFSIVGPATTPLNFFTKGILADPGVNSTTIRNGAISGFGEQVVADGTGGLFKDLILTNAGGTVIGDSEFGPFSVLNNVVTNQVLRVSCPAVIAQSTAYSIFYVTAPTSCVVSGTSLAF